MHHALCVYMHHALCVSAHMSVSYIRKTGGTAREIPSSWLLTILVHDVAQHFVREKTFSSPCEIRHYFPCVLRHVCIYFCLGETA